MKALVTSDETKENLGINTIALRAKLPVDLVAQVLRTLRDECRFVRRLPGEDEGFELSHDYLAREISSWMGAAEKEERIAHDLLDRELRAWKQFGSIRLGPDRLKYFREHLHLELLDQDAFLYLLLSSVRRLEPAEVWIGGVKALGAKRQSEIAHRLFEFFEDAEMATRREAAEVIGLLDASCVIRGIGSSKVSRKAAAIEMAGGLRLAAAAGPLLACLQDGKENENCRLLACGALSELLDQNAALLKPFLALARSDSSEPVRCAAIAALGRAHGNPDAFGLVHDAIRSGRSERRAAGVAAVKQGRADKFMEQLIESDHYSALDKDIRDSIWELILRMPKDKGLPAISKVSRKLNRDDLLRYNWEQWRDHWLNRALIEEFCRRYPSECRKREAKQDWQQLDRFDFTIEGIRKIVRAGLLEDLISNIRSGRGDKLVIGSFYESLLGAVKRTYASSRFGSRVA